MTQEVTAIARKERQVAMAECDRVLRDWKSEQIRAQAYTRINLSAFSKFRQRAFTLRHMRQQKRALKLQTYIHGLESRIIVTETAIDNCAGLLGYHSANTRVMGAWALWMGGALRCRVIRTRCAQMRDARWNRARAQLAKAIYLWHQDASALLAYYEQAIEVHPSVNAVLRMAVGMP